jgi:hypothetical protein
MKTKLRFIFATAFAVCFAQLYADTPISGLPAISNVAPTTIVPVVDVSGTPATKKATVSQLVNGLPAASSTNLGTMSAADKAKLDAATNANTPSTIAQRDASGNIAFNNVTAAKVTGLSAPTATSDAATKAYVDSVATGLNIKDPAVAATTANVTLAGGAPSILDGVTLNTNDRVLVKNQTDPTQNGIYYVQTLGTGANGTWVRTSDADTGAKLTTGSYIFITGGTAGSSTAWTMTTPGAITIGVSNINWALFSQIGNIQASNIVGQIVNAQIADAAVSFTKFANTIQPVSVVSSLPSPVGYTGPKTVFNTGDGKLYRYNGSAFTAAVNTSDLSGTITSTQIADNSISTPKLQANSVTAAQIAANSVQAGDIAANAVTAGTIAAGAVSTTELAAGAITSAKIAAGTIVSSNIAALTITGANIAAGTISVDKLNVNQLSAITANLGTVTAGSITASVSISLASSNNAVNIDTNGMTVAGGRVDFRSVFGRPCVTVYGAGSYNGDNIRMNGYDGTLPPFLQVQAGDASALTIIGARTGITTSGTAGVTIGSSGTKLNVVNYGSTVSNWVSGASEQTFTISVSGTGTPTAGFAQCSNDGSIIAHYDFDASNSSTAAFKVRNLDGTSFSGAYRFSYIIVQ